MLITQYVFCAWKSCGFVSTLLGRFRSMFLAVFGHHYHHHYHSGGYVTARSDLWVLSWLSALAFPARLLCLAFVFCNGQKLQMYLFAVCLNILLYIDQKFPGHMTHLKRKISLYMCTSCFAVTHRLQTCRHSLVNLSINVDDAVCRLTSNPWLFGGKPKIGQ